MSRDKLVYMANQIGKFFAHKSDEDAIAGIAEHLRSFWEKRMLAEAVCVSRCRWGGAGRTAEVGIGEASR